MHNKQVAVIGLWHLGSINAVGFCFKGYNVTGIETDSTKCKLLNDGVPAIYEPGLQEALKLHLQSGVLKFRDSLQYVTTADYVVIAFDSPVNELDEVDISPVLNAAYGVAPYLKHNVPIIITSQVPVGTCEMIESNIKLINSQWESGVVYTPENLKLGQAIDRFLNPDMLVLGANNQNALDGALMFYEPFVTEKITMNLKSSEMVKHALNTFLATSITFINEIAAISKKLGADAVLVGKALKLDKRIGKSALLMPGLGFSGGTLARDVKQLLNFSKEFNYNAPLLNAIFEVNQNTFDEVISILENRLHNLHGKTIGLLGLTYKADTSTVRRSPALKILELLNQKGAICRAYDPMADDTEIKDSNLIVNRVSSVEELSANADALVLLTEWSEFKTINYVDIARLMSNPIIVDTKNYLNKQVYVDAGFKYEGFGR